MTAPRRGSRSVAASSPLLGLTPGCGRARVHPTPVPRIKEPSGPPAVRCVQRAVASFGAKASSWQGEVPRRNHRNTAADTAGIARVAVMPTEDARSDAATLRGDGREKHPPSAWPAEVLPESRYGHDDQPVGRALAEAASYRLGPGDASPVWA